MFFFSLTHTLSLLPGTGESAQTTKLCDSVGTIHWDWLEWATGFKESIHLIPICPSVPGLYFLQADHPKSWSRSDSNWRVCWPRMKLLPTISPGKFWICNSFLQKLVLLQNLCKKRGGGFLFSFISLDFFSLLGSARWITNTCSQSSLKRMSLPSLTLLKTSQCIPKGGPIAPGHVLLINVSPPGDLATAAPNIPHPVHLLDLSVHLPAILCILFPNTPDHVTPPTHANATHLNGSTPDPFPVAPRDPITLPVSCHVLPTGGARATPNTCHNIHVTSLSSTREEVGRPVTSLLP